MRCSPSCRRSGGFDTYLIDWGTPTRAERFLTTDYYVNGYMLNVVEHLRERTGTEKVNVLGYCMGGTLSTMFTAIHQDLVKNLVLLATGIDYSTREGLLNLWTDERYFDVDRFVDTTGNIPAEFLQAAFLMLKPIANLARGLSPCGAAGRRGGTPSSSPTAPCSNPPG
jgi:polyhydroxyalkanoate synthase subunit PhaC